MENLNTAQDFVRMQEARETIDEHFTKIRVLDIWDSLYQGDDNSEDDSKLGLCSDMTVWQVVKVVSEKIDCPDIITVEHVDTGLWRRTTWRELVKAAEAREMGES